MVKVFLCKTWRHVGWCKYGSTRCNLGASSGWVLSSRPSPRYLFSGRFLIWSREKSLVRAGHLTTIPQLSSPQPTLYTDYIFEPTWTHSPSNLIYLQLVLWNNFQEEFFSPTSTVGLPKSYFIPFGSVHYHFGRWEEKLLSNDAVSC
jgi:hypothetical protein